MAKSQGRSVALEDFEKMLKVIIELQSQHRWKFIFQQKYIHVSIDKDIVDSKMVDIGLDIKIFKQVVNQITNIITSILDNEMDLAMPWFIENYGEADGVVERKFKLVEESLINEEIRLSKKLFDNCVFNYVKSFSWGIEDKYIEPVLGNQTYKVGILNFVIQENNPLASLIYPRLI